MRKFVYLLVLAVFAVAIYFFLGKKAVQTAQETPSTQAPVSSAEQTPAAPMETAAPVEAPSDAEHAANQVSADFGKLSDLTLTNQSGQEFRMADMKGKVLVFNFFFTKCEGPCPLMNKKMEALQEKFANDANVKLVSVTVDPANDNVEALKTYSAKFNANPEKWLFLTGDKEVIKDLMVKQMKLGGGDDATTHSTRFVLVDKDGNIKGFFDSSSEEELAKVENEARQLAAL